MRNRSWGTAPAGLLAACAAEPRPAADSDTAFGAGHAAAADDASAHASRASGAVAPTPLPSGTPAPMALPSDFKSTELGGYKLGPQLTAANADALANGQTDSSGSCAIMTAVVRDFRGADEPNGHPDFEAFDGKKPSEGLLAPQLGADRKPVYASHCEANYDKTLCPYGQMTTSAERFGQWYRSTADVNLAYALSLAFEQNANVYTFQSTSFFPLDDTGFGNSGGKRKHNFSFTTELHGTFQYRGGEQFSFTGDDDLWVFINGRLAIDLGGLHPPATAKVDLDARADQLGIAPGQSYALDLFHAERHSASSNFRVDTTIAFTDCGQVTPELL